MWFSNLLILKITSRYDMVKIQIFILMDHVENNVRLLYLVICDAPGSQMHLRTTSLMIQHDHGLTIFCATAVGYCW